MAAIRQASNSRWESSVKSCNEQCQTWFLYLEPLIICIPTNWYNRNHHGQSSNPCHTILSKQCHTIPWKQWPQMLHVIQKGSLTFFPLQWTMFTTMKRKPGRCRQLTGAGAKTWLPFLASRIARYDLCTLTYVPLVPRASSWELE